MADIEVLRRTRPEDLAALSQFLSAVAEADAHPPLGEQAWLDLLQGGREGFAGLVAFEPTRSQPVGYAQLSREDSQGERAGEGRNWALELVIDPDHRSPRNTVAAELVRSALAIVSNDGGGHLQLWVNQPGPVLERLAATMGLRPSRTLYQMRRPLPVEEHSTISTRPFRLGEDEHAWLELNNRAFASHPEQGGWTQETLKARQRQPWFDPKGFLLYEQGERLVGFCWTKVHGTTTPAPNTFPVPRTGRLGEIYVIAVDPQFGHHGLGRELLLAGLGYLSAEGITEAMLYVDATNVPAVKMYVSLGFVVNHIDRAYTADIPAAT